MTRLGGEAALAFNEGMWIGFTGTLDAVVLARALDFLSMRHTVLRTTFAADGCVPDGASGAFVETGDRAVRGRG